jgi:signal peptidase I
MLAARSQVTRVTFVAINFDDPWFPYALLAILLGLRLASYAIHRIMDAHPDPVAAPDGPALAPDDPAIAEQVMPPLQLDMAVAAPPPAPVATEFDVAAEPAATPPETLWEEDAAAPPPAAPAEHVTEPESAGEPRERPTNLWHELLDSAMIAVILVFCIIRPFLLQAFYIPSGSMEPTLQIQDKVLASKITYRLREPRAGDIIVFHAPRKAQETHMETVDLTKPPPDYVKRVVGVPGDRIRIDFDGVHRNGVLVKEPYTAPNYEFPITSYGDFSPKLGAGIPNDLQPHVKGRDLVIPKGYLLVLGDNRNDSHDGHVWGLLPRDTVIGNVVFVFWPLSRLGPVR